jgi:hypothetical protein
MAKQKPDTATHEPSIYGLHGGALKKVNDDVEKLSDEFHAHRVNMAEAIGALDAKVSNGLTTRMESMDKRMWAFAGGFIIVLGGMIWSAIMIAQRLPPP